MVELAAFASQCRNRGRQRLMTDPTERLLHGLPRKRRRPIAACQRGRKEFQERAPEQRDPSQEDDPSGIRVGNEQVLQLRLRRVGIISNEDDENHAENVGHIRAQESTCKHCPESRRRAVVLGEDKCCEGGCEDAERIDTRTRRCDHDRHGDPHLLWRKGEPRSRVPRDRVDGIRDSEDRQNGAGFRGEGNP